MNKLDKEVAKHIYKSLNDTEYWFRHVLRTKVPGHPGLALTTQQLAYAKDFDELYRCKTKKVKGEELTEEETEIASKFGLSAQSGKCTGKTTLVAGLALKSLVCFNGEVKETDRSHTLILGASYDQTKSTIWAEMNRLLAGSIIADDVYIGAEKAYRRWPDPVREKLESTYCFIELRATNVAEGQRKQAKKFSGYHAPVELFILDESTGIGRPVCTELESTLGYVGGVSIMLVCFNPDVPVCYATETQTVKRRNFLCHQWNAEKSELTDDAYIQGRRDEWGEDSNEYIQWVLGLLPPASDDTLIPWQWLQEAVNKRFEVDEIEPLFFAYDPKGRGKCEATLSIRQGPVFRKILVNNIPDTKLQADWICDQVLEELEHHPEGIRFKILIEITGVGVGVYDNMKHHPTGLGHKRILQAVDVNIPLRRTWKTQVPSSKPTTPKKKYKTERDRLWDRVRQGFQDGTLQLVDDRKTIDQLGMLTFDNSSGFFRVVPKKEIGKDIGRADSVMISLASDVKKVYNMPEQQRHDNRVYESSQRSRSSAGWMYA
jgi:hypothetical protein